MLPSADLDACPGPPPARSSTPLAGRAAGCPPGRGASARAAWAGCPSACISGCPARGAWRCPGGRQAAAFGAGGAGCGPLHVACWGWGRAAARADPAEALLTCMRHACMHARGRHAARRPAAHVQVQLPQAGVGVEPLDGREGVAVEPQRLEAGETLEAGEAFDAAAAEAQLDAVCWWGAGVRGAGRGTSLLCRGGRLQVRACDNRPRAAPGARGAASAVTAHQQGGRAGAHLVRAWRCARLPAALRAGRRCAAPRPAALASRHRARTARRCRHARSWCHRYRRWKRNPCSADAVSSAAGVGKRPVNPETLRQRGVASPNAV